MNGGRNIEAALLLGGALLMQPFVAVMERDF